MMKNIKYIVFSIVAFFVIDFFYEYYSFKKYNQTPLCINTFDGSNQPYHPSVLFFPTGWCGHRYWMVETPYPIGGKPYRDRWEIPLIHTSEDGLNWDYPLGGVNLLII